MSFIHLTLQDRSCIFHQQNAGFINAEIGRRTGRHRSTIGRELRRFRRHVSWPFYRGYMPDAAEQVASANRARPCGARWIRSRKLLAYTDQG